MDLYEFITYIEDEKEKNIAIKNAGYKPAFLSYFFTIACTNPWNKGCGRVGLDLNSGCACVAAK